MPTFVKAYTKMSGQTVKGHLRRQRGFAIVRHARKRDLSSGRMVKDMGIERIIPTRRVAEHVLTQYRRGSRDAYSKYVLRERFKIKPFYGR